MCVWGGGVLQEVWNGGTEGKAESSHISGGQWYVCGGLYWCSSLAFHMGTFPVHGESQAAHTNLIQSKYFHTSLVSHKLLLYQTINIRSWTFSLLSSTCKDLIILGHSGKLGGSNPYSPENLPEHRHNCKILKVVSLKCERHQIKQNTHEKEKIGCLRYPLFLHARPSIKPKGPRQCWEKRVSGVWEWSLPTEGRAPQVAGREGISSMAGGKRSPFCFTTLQSHQEMQHILSGLKVTLMLRKKKKNTFIFSSYQQSITNRQRNRFSSLPIFLKPLPKNETLMLSRPLSV